MQNTLWEVSQQIRKLCHDGTFYGLTADEQRELDKLIEKETKLIKQYGPLQY